MSTPADSDEDDPFIVSSPLEIRSIMRSIERSSALLRMHIQGNPDQSIMTTILAFDPVEHRVILDCSSDTVFNRRLLDAKAVVFDTQVDRISIQFTATDLRNCTYDDLPALSIPLPPSARRLQRREYYRVEIPVGEPANCTILLAEPGKAPRRAVVRMKDISAGGVALLDTENQLPHESGITFSDVRMTLPEVGEVVVELDVLRIHTIVLPNRKEVIEVACRFHDMSKAAVNMVQNYIGRLERRLNAKRRGF